MTDSGGFGPPSGPPAGWYPDPYHPSSQRYWDGRQWDLSAAGTGSGSPPEDDFPDIGDWLDRSFRTALGRWRATSVIALVTTPFTTVASYVAINRLSRGIVITDDGVEGWTNDRLVPAIALLLVAAIASAIGWLALTRLMLDSVDGAEPHETTTGSEIGAAGRALAAGLAILPRAVGWLLVLLGAAIVVALVLAVIAAAVGPLVVLVVFVLAPTVVWLAVKWAFVVVAIVDAPGDPFARSGSTSRGRWWSTLGRLLLLGVIMWLVSLIVQVIGSVASGGGLSGFGGGTTIEVDQDGNFDPIYLDDELGVGAWTIGVATVVAVVGTVVASSVTAVAMSVLYRTRNPRPE
jgi:hypothetical protein